MRQLAFVGEGTINEKHSCFSRLGMLAVGLGIGGALASTPGIASADVATDWLSSVDGSLGPLSAAAALPNLNIAISVNGVVLFQHGTAEAVSGKATIAIANGAGS